MSGLGSNVEATQAVISLRAYMNPTGPTQQAILNFTSADSFTADASAVLTKSVAAATSNSSFNLATLFNVYDAPVLVAITETTNPGLGFKITTASNASGKCGVAANGTWLYLADAVTALPTVYIDNADATETLYFQIAVMTQ